MRYSNPLPLADWTTSEQMTRLNSVTVRLRGICTLTRSRSLHKRIRISLRSFGKRRRRTGSEMVHIFLC